MVARALEYPQNSGSSGYSFLDPEWRAEAHDAKILREIVTDHVALRLFAWGAAAPVKRVLSSDSLSWLNVALKPRDVLARGIVHGVERQLGNVFYLPRGASLLVASERDAEQLSLAALFDPDFFNIANDLPRSADEGAWLDIAEPRVKANLMRLYEELQAPGFASALLVEGIMLATSVELARYSTLHRETSGTGLSYRRKRAVLERLHADLPPPSLSELAALCAVSPRHFGRQFRATTGQTLTQYVANMQAARASRLLAETAMPIKEIAFQIGFAKVPAFYAAFRKVFGVTPTQYRAQNGDSPATRSDASGNVPSTRYVQAPTLRNA